MASSTKKVSWKSCSSSAPYAQNLKKHSTPYCSRQRTHKRQKHYPPGRWWLVDIGKGEEEKKKRVRGTQLILQFCLIFKYAFCFFHVDKMNRVCKRKKKFPFIFLPKQSFYSFVFWPNPLTHKKREADRHKTSFILYFKYNISHFSRSNIFQNWLILKI